MFRDSEVREFELAQNLSVEYTALLCTDFKLWNTSTWELDQNLKDSKWVWDAAFCADSSYLVTASSDSTARLWNLRDGAVVRQYHGHQSAVTCVALNDSSV